MCYYNGVRVSRAEYIRLKQEERTLKYLNSIRKLGNGFDYSDWPIIKPRYDGRVFDIVDAHWEFIPKWINNKAELHESRKKFTTLNATSEKLLESRMFRDAALKRRCLVLSSGFWEWRHFRPESAKKDIAYPYYISLPDKPLFFIAGIWQPWVDQNTGESFDTFAIVTTKANELMSQIHNKKLRMPTILTQDMAEEWITDNLDENRINEIASYQYDSEEMSAWSVRKEFREQYNILEIDPAEEFDYPELPPLMV